MINVIQKGAIYELSFKYDPALIYLVKNVPGRRWDPDNKIWTIPSENLGIFLNEVKGTIYEQITNVVSNEHLNENATVDSTVVIPDIKYDESLYLVKEGAKPFAHQIDFMKYSIDRYKKGNKNGFILTDEQGLAKTSEVMNWALYQRKHSKYKHCLVIVCINGAKYNWVDDIILHTQGKEIPYILGSRLKRDGKVNPDAGSAAKLDDLKTGHMYGNKKHPKLPFFLVMNIEAVRMKQGRKMPIMEEIIKLVRDGEINLIAIDEVHLNMSPGSLQGKAILKIKQQTASMAEWIPMTGTPITNKPTDVFTPLKLVNGHTFKDYWSWCQHFIVYGGFQGHDVMGYKNIPQLKTMLQSNMLRRLKKDVYDLPPKIPYTIYVENTPIQEKLYRELQAELKQKKSEILEQMNPLVALLKLRQINGSPELVDPSILVDSDYHKKNAKIKRIMELLEEIHERGEKVIIYSNWVEPLKSLYKFVSAKYKTCCYTGTMKGTDREQHKQTFINNPDYTVMIGTIGALGVSHTLTVARNVIFLDEPWGPSAKDQAEDRIHRPGTTESVNIYTIITKDTIDEVVHNIIGDKRAIAMYIVDDQLNLRHNSDLFDRLIA